MQKLVWQNSNGDVIDLTSGNYNITNWEGFSNADLNIQSQQVPFEDGGVFLDALIEQRELSVTLAMNDNGNLEERYRMRRELIHILNPKLGEGYLIYTNDFISKRIKCVAQIPLFETHNSNDSGTPKASLAWTACEPYWEDLEETEVIFDITEQPTIINNGDIPIQLKITFNTKNAVNPCLLKENDNTKIQFNGNLGKMLLINTNIGKKSARTVDIGFILSSFSNYQQFAYAEDLDLFVFIGTNEILVTKDLVNFSMKKSLINNQQDIAYSEELGLFVIVSYENIITSSDGLTWTDRGNVGTFGAITYDTYLQKFIALGPNGNISMSANGIDWEDFSVGNNSLYASANNENIVVFVGYNRSLFTTTDGINFVDRSSAVPANVDLYNVSYINEISKFVACGSKGCIMTSSDGINWQSFIINNEAEYHSVYYNKNTYNVICIAIFDAGVAISPSGENWNFINSNVSSFYKTEYLDKYGYALSIGRGIMGITTNGYNYNYINNTGAYGNLRDVAYSENGIYCFATMGGVYRTEDLKHYEYINIHNVEYRSIIYIKTLRQFVLVGFRRISQSSDGKVWNDVTIPINTKTFYSVAYSEKLKKLVVVGESGTILAGTLDNLEEVASGVTSQINDVIYVEEQNKFIACCENGTVLTSIDGINWNNYQTGVTNLRSIIFVKLYNLFYAVGNNSYVTSYDGIVWSENKQINNNSYNLYDIQYINALNIFILISSNIIWNSTNGSDWEAYDFSANLIKVKEISYQDKKVLIMGLGGVLFSNFTKDNNVIDKITNDSNMNLNLSIGNNKFRLTQEDGRFVCILGFRQKYIGV